MQPFCNFHGHAIIQLIMIVDVELQEDRPCARRICTIAILTNCVGKQIHAKKSVLFYRRQNMLVIVQSLHLLQATWHTRNILGTCLVERQLVIMLHTILITFLQRVLKSDVGGSPFV